MVSAQHGPGRRRPESALVYDTNSEATLKGTVTDVKSGQSRLSRVFQFHTLGLGHKGVQEKQLLLKTDTETVQIHLGPTAFLTENNVEIRKGDTLEVTGSRITVSDSHVILARAFGSAATGGRFGTPRDIRCGGPTRQRPAHSGRRIKSFSPSSP
jgi:hypothetical protein